MKVYAMVLMCIRAIITSIIYDLKFCERHKQTTLELSWEIHLLLNESKMEQPQDFFTIVNFQHEMIFAVDQTVKSC